MLRGKTARCEYAAKLKVGGVTIHSGISPFDGVDVPCCQVRILNDGGAKSQISHQLREADRDQSHPHDAKDLRR